MQKLLLSIFGLFLAGDMIAQDYPVPEYSNEICLYKKDSAKLMRLEKGSSRMETKVKMMGLGGMNNGYELEGEASNIRLTNGHSLVFIYYTGPSATSTSFVSDSAMRANGVDPAMVANAMSMMGDPSKTTSLYNMSPENGKRKITLQSASGMGILGKTKRIGTKYTLSIKKVKEGYYEISVDKTLPKGEYAFVMMSMGNMDGSYALFAFGVD